MKIEMRENFMVQKTSCFMTLWGNQRGAQIYEIHMFWRVPVQKLLSSEIRENSDFWLDFSSKTLKRLCKSNVNPSISMIEVWHGRFDSNNRFYVKVSFWHFQRCLETSRPFDNKFWPKRTFWSLPDLTHFIYSKSRNRRNFPIYSCVKKLWK